jgi:hypothetical protein
LVRIQIKYIGMSRAKDFEKDSKMEELYKHLLILQERQVSFEQETTREIKRLKILVDNNQQEVQEFLEEFDETIEGIHLRTDGLYRTLKETKMSLLRFQDTFSNNELPQESESETNTFDLVANVEEVQQPEDETIHVDDIEY